jgi:uracil-DNA glycosylase
MLSPDEIAELQATWTANKALVPFTFIGGSKSASIVIVGEAWGESEDQFKHPFVGYSGQELARMLSEAGLTRPFITRGTYITEATMVAHWCTVGLCLTNVFPCRPPDNKLTYWCSNKKEAGSDYPLPFLKSGNYIQREFLVHIDRLVDEIKQIRPNLVLCLGNTACWALLKQTTISKIRGTVTWSSLVNAKVLPTYHPSAVLQNWSLRTIVLQDFAKAKREALFPEIRRPERWVTINPTIDDIYCWAERPARMYAVDIETVRGQISMVGFARARDDALVIPFINEDGSSYWATHEDEVRAWGMVKELLERPMPKLFQNGLFDLSYLVPMGIRPQNCTEDTMLLHHSLFPEMRKGLDFLGSVYTDEVAWKLMRHRTKDEAEKRED